MRPTVGPGSARPAATDADYAACRALHRRADPTYYWATRRLPRDKRAPTHALYGYVRVADDLVDGPARPPTPDDRRAALDAWEAQLEAPVHPAARALHDARARHPLPLEELAGYFDSMRVDCGPVRIESWEELDRYMDGSAGSVGRIMASLLDVPDRHRPAFGELGIAFQLTNFLRDVREDWVLDRVYLPEVDPDDLARPRASRELRAGVAAAVRRARGRFAAAAPAVASAPTATRAGIRMACAAYVRILDHLEATGHDVLAARTGVRAGDLPRIAAAGLGR